MTRSAGAAMLLVLACVSAQAAQQWVVLRTASPNIIFSVDMRSIRRDGPRVKFRERLVYLKPQYTDAVSGERIKEKRVHRVMDCARHTQGFTYGAMYAEGGRFIESTSLDGSRLRLTAVPPGTIAEKELELVCGAAGKK